MKYAVKLAIGKLEKDHPTIREFDTFDEAKAFCLTESRKQSNPLVIVDNVMNEIVSRYGLLRD